MFVNKYHLHSYKTLTISTRFHFVFYHSYIVTKFMFLLINEIRLHIMSTLLIPSSPENAFVADSLVELYVNGLATASFHLSCSFFEINFPLY